MNIPTPTIDSLPAAARKKLSALLAERAMFGLVFSYAKLIKVADNIDTLKKCIKASDDDEAKEEKAVLNDGISTIMSENLTATEKGTISVRGEDQFGITRDLIYVESKGIPQVSKSRLLENAPKFKIPIDVAIKWIESATTQTPFTTVQCRKVRVKEDK